MTETRNLLKALAALLPLGAFGASSALAAVSAPPVVATDAPPAAGTGVAARLQAIRAAVTAAKTGLEPGAPDIRKAWWGNWHAGWGNGGWRNWPNFWRNW